VVKLDGKRVSIYCLANGVFVLALSFAYADNKLNSSPYDSNGRIVCVICLTPLRVANGVGAKKAFGLKNQGHMHKP
jgi:hypothetical protein